MMQYTFDENSWRNTCESLAAAASKRCGLSHDVYVGLYSAEINQLLGGMSEEYHSSAIKIAREYDYANNEEIEASEEWNSEHGHCQHGLDPDCCPVGCGEI